MHFRFRISILDLMCGRYASHLPPEAIARLFRAVNPVPNHAASWNVAPRQDALVVRRHPDTGERHLDLLTWGLVPCWTKDLTTARRPINARAETVSTSGMFRAAFAARRCLVPADAFYEWKPAGHAGKQPFAVARRDAQPMAFAGLWEGWRAADGEVLRTFTIITTDANAVLRPIHNRMPVIVESADWPVWLDEAEGDPTALMRPAAEDVLQAWSISTRVNNVRNNGPDLLEPA